MRSRMMAVLALATLAFWGCGSPMDERTPRDPDDVGVDVINRANSSLPGVDVPAKPLPATSAGITGSFRSSNALAPDQEEELLIIPKRKSRVPNEPGKVLVPPTFQEGAEGWKEAELLRGCSLHTRVQDHIIPLPLQHTDVRAQLTFAIGSVTVTQQ